MDPKRQAIAQAAQQLFFRHGYAKTTMQDIAGAARISRPTLYAAFENKEAVFGALLELSAEQHDRESVRLLARKKALKDRLAVLFDLWVVAPFASVVDSENGRDLLTNCAVYAPEATTEFYRRLEAQLAAVLKPAMPTRRGMTAADLAHILTTAVRGLKSTTGSLPEMRRMVDGLLTMAIATAGARASG